uniref:Uncharacterized protein n=1 Tax=Picea glauca TaxID=3330 RepID=A0A117NJ52_PICGL|nr:hypothetical protein ABT39_MTgene809 [Picea glauca]
MNLLLDQAYILLYIYIRVGVSLFIGTLLFPTHPNTPLHYVRILLDVMREKALITEAYWANHAQRLIR